MQKEEYEEWMSVGEDIPVTATLTDLEICPVICDEDQAIKVDDSDGDECVEENPPTNAEMSLVNAVDILTLEFESVVGTGKIGEGGYNIAPFKACDSTQSSHL
ncbi:hypothetical protein AVEN_266794-1 [Araneus ventricosus]|uniref:Uncharacterized protein n=1 Tax=Araneus ventricosus TaxID=182803 RepID=A0A4Y2GD17_ARAVE|nr:hypothetical protein AVEN_266794-1 [Araneus ventricosus]